MEKKFALKAAKALKQIKALSAKNEYTTKFSLLDGVPCCYDGPVLPPPTTTSAY